MGHNGGRWRDGTYEAMLAMGLCISKCEQQKGRGTENPETEHYSLVSGVLCETTAGDGKGRWWGVSYEVMMIVERHICKCKAERGLGTKNLKPETKPLWLGFRSAVSNSCGRQ